MPFGKAQYIARVLNDRLTACQNEKALNDLKDKLRERKDEIYSVAQAKAKRKFTIPLSKPAEIQLRCVIEDLARKSTQDLDPYPKSVLGNLFVISITKRTFEKVCEQLGI